MYGEENQGSDATKQEQRIKDQGSDAMSKNQGALQAFVALVLWRALGRPLAT